MCGDALLVAPIVRAGGEVELALPPGDWYDLNTRQRVAGRQVLRYRAKLDQFPVFGREGYVLPLGRAVQHTGEIDDERPLELAVGVRPADGDAFRLRAGSHRRATESRVAQARDRASVGRRAACPSPASRSMPLPPTLAVTVGEPAGIGPELCAMLAARHAQHRRSPARLVLLGDRALLDARARRIGLTPGYADYDPRALRAGGRRGRSVAPRRSPRRSRRARPIPRTRAACCTCSTSRLRRMRDRRVRGARHRADAEERDDGRRHRVPRAHRISRASARTRRAS